MTLLPPNATRLERAIEQVMVRLLDIEVPIDRLWSTARCPEHLLPYLAWALSVDDWDPTWSEDRRRDVIAASIEIQRHKGTLWAVKRILTVMGYGRCTVIERWGAKRHDGSIIRNGTHSYAPQDHWAEYRVILEKPITLEQAVRVRSILSMVAPAACHLKALDYQRALNLRDGSICFDGTYTRGIA